MNYTAKVDPLITSTAGVNYSIERSASELTVQNTYAQSPSNSQINFNIPTSNPETWLSRKLILNLSARVTCTASIPGGAIFPGGRLNGVMGLRFLPLQNVCSTINCTINNTTVSTNARDYLDALCRFGFDHSARDGYMSIEPSAQDVSQAYADTNGTAINPIYDSPFANVVNSPRGTFGTIISDDGTTAVVDFKWAEIVTLVPPLAYQKTDRYGFLGINNFNISFIIGNISRIVSYDQATGRDLANIVVDLTAGDLPMLQSRWLNAPFPVTGMGTYLYPYSSVDGTSCNMGTINAGTSKTYTSTSISVPAIPSRLYIYGTTSQATKTAFDTDCYLLIENLQVKFLNKSNIYGDYSPVLLYEQFQAKNGWKHSWAITNKHLGSVFAIDFGQDFPLPAGKAPGVQGKEQLQITVTAKNLSAVNSTFDLWIVPVYDGIFTMSNMKTSTSINILDSNDVIAADFIGAAEAAPSSLENFHLEGGSLDDVLGGLKKFASKAGGAVKSGLDFYTRNKQEIQAAAAIAKMLGQAAADFLPMIIGAGFQGDAEEILAGAGYSNLEIQHVRNLSGGCMGGALISDPNRLLGGSMRHKVPIRTATKTNSLYGRH